jgi:putative phosphoesterase
LAATLGLISDTHFPDRLRPLPAALGEIFRGCDLLLHAGDVGELRVLDELGQTAPVVAVHGNDDTAEAQLELPEQQLLTVAGLRILLWHSHDPRRATELRLREADSWPVLLGRIRERARRAGATIAVFGHIHVPMQQEESGILLVNPGALAPGNHYLRQRLQSVALLFVRDDGVVAVRHVDLSDPQQLYTPLVDWQASFTTAHNAVSETILGPGLGALEVALRNGDFAGPDGVKAAYHRLAHRCWEGQLARITAADVLAEVTGNPDIPDEDQQKIRRLLDQA